VLRWVVALQIAGHGERLARPGLAIGEDGCIVALKHGVAQRLHLLHEDVLLGKGVVEHGVECPRVGIADGMRHGDLLVRQIHAHGRLVTPFHLLGSSCRMRITTRMFSESFFFLDMVVARPYK
jgi:hypothetical protein